MSMAKHYGVDQLLWRLVGLWPSAARRRLWLPKQLTFPVKRTFRLAMCAIVRNEEPYIDEWLEFHIMQGVSHFYIYDNGSTDGTVSKLEQSPHASAITVVQWNNFISGWEGVTGLTGHMQRLSMLHCLANYGHTADWIAFIDLDEFLYPTKADSLIELLDQYDDLPSLSVYWNMFGSSGHITRPEGLVSENYIMRRRRPDPQNKHLCRVKSIVRPSAVRGVHNSHTLILGNKHPESWTEKRTRIGYADHRIEHFSNDVVRINHYYSKSHEEYRARKQVPSEGPRRNFRNNDKLLQLIEQDTIEDLTIQRFVPELKRRLQANAGHEQPSNITPLPKRS